MDRQNSHLSAAELTDLKQELESQLDRLEQSMRVTEESLGPVELDQTRVGRLSRMDEMQNQSLTKNLREREEVKLALIHEALRRLVDGTYGLCRECGGPIAYDRLFVYPEAPSCANCA